MALLAGVAHTGLWLRYQYLSRDRPYARRGAAIIILLNAAILLEVRRGEDAFCESDFVRRLASSFSVHIYFRRSALPKRELHSRFAVVLPCHMENTTRPCSKPKTAPGVIYLFTLCPRHVRCPEGCSYRIAVKAFVEDLSLDWLQLPAYAHDIRRH